MFSYDLVTFEIAYTSKYWSLLRTEDIWNNLLFIVSRIPKETKAKCVKSQRTLFRGKSLTIPCSYPSLCITTENKPCVTYSMSFEFCPRIFPRQLAPLSNRKEYMLFSVCIVFTFCKSNIYVLLFYPVLELNAFGNFRNLLLYCVSFKIDFLSRLKIVQYLKETVILRKYSACKI